MEDPDSIALFDLDEVLAAYATQMLQDLERMRSPGEDELDYVFGDDIPPHAHARMQAIKARRQWWEHLPRNQLGWDVLGVARELGYKIEILTQTPRDSEEALIGKRRWVQRELGDVTICITDNKSRVYGRVLVDDFPSNLNAWLAHRPRGLGIMPATPVNERFSHERVIRYDGSNLNKVRDAMETTRDLERDEVLQL